MIKRLIASITSDTTGRKGHNVHITIYKKVFVRDLNDYVVVCEKIDISTNIEYIFSGIREGRKLITFLGKDYTFEQLTSTEFKDYYESYVTQETLKKIIIDDVFENYYFDFIPDDVEFEWDLFEYKIYTLSEIKELSTFL